MLLVFFQFLGGGFLPGISEARHRGRLCEGPRLLRSVLPKMVVTLEKSSGRRGVGRQGCSRRERRSDDLRQTIRDLVCKSSRMFSMQECIASWAHLFANFSWWGCLMIVVAGVQSDVYHRKVKVVTPRTGRSARRRATAPSARSARPTSRLESCASSCCITGRQCVANSSRPNLRGHLPNAKSNRGEGLQQSRKVRRVCRVGIHRERH